MARLKPGLYDVDLAWKGGVRKTSQINVDPGDPDGLRKVLLDQMWRFRKDREPFLKNYELRLRNPGRREVLMKFVAV